MVRRIQGWDPVLIVSQISTLQTLHYLLLALFVPPALTVLTTSQALTYAGGPYVKSYILDWREISSRTTAPKLPRKPPERKQSESVLRARRDGDEGVVMKEVERMLQQGEIDTRGAERIRRGIVDIGKGEGEAERPTALRKRDSEKTHYAVKDSNDGDYEVWDYGVSRRRGWILGGLWVLVSIIDIIPLYYLIRKPTLILDHALTLLFIHIVLTTYHTGHFPTSFFFWVVMALGALITVVGAEQLCVRREMNEGLGAEMFKYDQVEQRDTSAVEEYELNER